MKPWLIDIDSPVDRFIGTTALNRELRVNGYDGYIGFGETADNPSPKSMVSDSFSTNDSPSSKAFEERSRQDSIKDYIEQERLKHDPEESYRRVLREEVEKAQKEGKRLKVRDSDNVQDISSILESDSKLLDSDIESIRESLGDDANAVPRSPENKDAIMSAVNCILENAK
jgi:hypothetical protein